MCSLNIGNIDSDDYETADFKLFVKDSAGKKVVLPVRYTYRDANNKLYEEKQNLELRLYTPEELEAYNFVQKKSYSAVIVVIVVLLAAYLGWRRFKKRK